MGLKVDSAISSFKQTAEPIRELIEAIEREQGQEFREETAVRKVIENYKDSGLNLRTNATAMYENFRQIVHSICPNASEKEVALFCAALKLEDFCYSEGGM